VTLQMGAAAVGEERAVGARGACCWQLWLFSRAHFLLDPMWDHYSLYTRFFGARPRCSISIHERGCQQWTPPV